MDSMIYHLQRLVQADLLKIEELNLKQVNKTKYNDLKTRLEALDKKIALCNNDNPAATFPLKWEYAKISSELDFYLHFLNGIDEIYTYKVSKVKEALESILNKLNSSNYLEVEKELQETLDFFKETLNNVVNALEVTSLADEIRYKIFKLKLDNQIIDDSIPIVSFLAFILKDINQIMENNNVSHLIKDRLSKYLINPSEIVNDYQSILILINLSTRKDITEERILFELNERKYYHSKDLEKDYIIVNEVWDRKIDFKKNTFLAKDDNEINSNENVDLILRVLNYFYTNSQIVDLDESIIALKNSPFKRWNTLFQGFTYGFYDNGFAIFDCMKKSFHIVKAMPELGYYIECALISNIEKIASRSLGSLKQFALDN